MFLIKIILPIKNVKNLLYYSKSYKNLNIGSRVIVPLKNYKLMGIISNIYKKKKIKKKFKIKKIAKILDKKKILNKKLLKLIKISSKYYQIPFNIFLFNLIPKYNKKKNNLKFKYKKKCKILKKIKNKYIKITNKIYKKKKIWLLNSNFKERLNIYINLIKKNFFNNKQVLFLVPKKYLIKKIKKYINKYIYLNIEILSSEVSNNKKIYIWKKILDGKISIILGTRSAIFTPFSKLNLIIIEEEDSKYYKEKKKFLYNSKNIGLLRSKIENIPILLGSSTPSIKSFYKSKIKKYNFINIKNKKIKNNIKIININNNKINNILKKILHKYIKKEIYIFILINTKKYYLIICKHCKLIQKCFSCNNKYIIHKKKNKFKCYKCKKNTINKKCNKCKKNKFYLLGWNIKKLKKLLIKIFPFIKIKILNSKIKKKHNQKIFISKKLIWNKNIPKPNIVLIFNIDDLFYSNNYKSIEIFIKKYTLFIKKIKSNKKQKIIFLTKFPKHNMFKYFLKKKKYKYIIEKILKERKLINYPPYVHESSIRIKYNKNIYKLYKIINYISKKKKINTLKPFLIKKKKNIYIWQIILQSKSYKDLSYLIKKIKKKWKKKIKFTLDIDYDE